MRNELLSLANVGKAVARDLDLLGIKTISQLKNKDPKIMYDELSRIKGAKQDPCMLDTLCAIVHEAKTGEKKPWWYWSRIRKGELYS